jgi:organic radical activating enzyme
MKIVFLNDYDIVNYKKPSMFIGFPCCTFKCNKESGQNVCQNYELIKSKLIDVTYEEVVKEYIENPLTSAIVFGGLEPFDTYEDVKSLIKEFRKYTNDEIVIYTGYNEDEVKNKTALLSKNFTNIIVKFGRFMPNTTQHFDEILGVKLFGDNQYAKKIS